MIVLLMTLYNATLKARVSCCSVTHILAVRAIDIIDHNKRIVVR